ncbi:MAG: Maf family protein [Vampirovibrio sp.]|nr:Maf family protein [Vampirovibrio sp.]
MTKTKLPPVILASGSPRRRELMGGLGIPFTVTTPGVDEAAIPVEGLSPGEIVKKLSLHKAQAIASANPDALVIGSDTIVVMADELGPEEVMGKPVDRQDAARMLNRLQDNEHRVYSGITVMGPNASGQPETRSDFLCTRVWMRPMTTDEIETYIDTGEPMDKAGAYAIQGQGSLNIERIEGCYFNVVGMSMYLLNRLIRELGYSLQVVPQGGNA